MDLTGFNPDEHEPSSSFEPLAEGWYVVMITDSEERKTRAGDGSYLSLTYEIDDGEAKGRKVWENLNLNNPNPKTVEIATRSLADICRAVGVMAPRSSEELHFKRLAIRLVIKEWNGEKRNEVKGHRAIKGEATSGSRSAPPASSKQAAPAAPKTPPWQRKAG